PDAGVRGSVMLALGALGEKARPFLPALIPALAGSAEETEAASTALIRLGAVAIPELLEMLEKEPRPGDRAMKSRVVKILGRMDAVTAGQGIATLSRMIRSAKQPALQEDLVAVALLGLDAGDSQKSLESMAAEALAKLGPAGAAELVDLVQSDDEAVRMVAAAGLAGTETPLGAHAPVFAGVLAKEPNPHVRANLLRAFGSMGAEGLTAAGDDFLKGLEDPLPAVRLAATKALEACAPAEERFINALVDRLDDVEQEVRDGAASALFVIEHPRALFYGRLYNGSWDGFENFKDFSAEIIRALGHASSKVRFGTAKAVVSGMNRFKGQEAEVIGALVGVVQAEAGDPFGHSSEAAIEALEAFGPKAAGAVMTLIAILGGKNPDNVRMASAKALGAMGPEAAWAVPALLAALNDKNNEVVLAATQALVKIGAPAVDPLLKAVDPGKKRLHELAVSILGQIETPKAKFFYALQKEGMAGAAEILAGDPGARMPFLIEALGHSYSKWCNGALTIVGSYPDLDFSPAVPALMQMLQDPVRDPKERIDEKVLGMAADALGKIGSPALDALKRFKPLHPAVRAAQARAYGRMGPLAREVTSALLENMKDEDGGLRVAAAEALGRVSSLSPEVAGALDKALDDGDKRVVVEAAKSLGRFGEGTVTGYPAVFSKLRTLVKEEDETKSAAAAVAIERMGTSAQSAEEDLLAALDVTRRPVSYELDLPAEEEILNNAFRAIAHALMKIGTPRARFYALLASDKTEEAAAMNTEAFDGVTEAIRALGFSNPRMRMSAAEVLAIWGPAAKAAVPALTHALYPEPKDGLVTSFDHVGLAYSAVIAALGAMGGEAETALPRLTDLLKNSRVDKAAYDAIIAIGRERKEAASQALRDAIAAAGRHNYLVSGHLLEWAISALGELGDSSPENIEILYEMFNPVGLPVGSVNDIQGLAEEAMAKFGAPAVPKLRGILQEVMGWSLMQPPERQRQILAAQTLAKIGPAARDAVGDLITLLKDKNADLVNACANALGAIGEAAAEAVVPLMDKVRALLYGRPSRRRSLELNDVIFACALGKIGPPAKAAVPLLLDILEKSSQALGNPKGAEASMIGFSNTSLRKAAEEALDAIGPATDPAMLGKIVPLVSSRYPAVSLRALDSVGTIAAGLPEGLPEDEWLKIVRTTPVTALLAIYERNYERRHEGDPMIFEHQKFQPALIKDIALKINEAIEGEPAHDRERIRIQIHGSIETYLDLAMQLSERKGKGIPPRRIVHAVPLPAFPMPEADDPFALEGGVIDVMDAEGMPGAVDLDAAAMEVLVGEEFQPMFPGIYYQPSLDGELRMILKYLETVHSNTPLVLKAIAAIGQPAEAFEELRKTLPVNNPLTRIIRALGEPSVRGGGGGFLDVTNRVIRSEHFPDLMKVVCRLAGEGMPFGTQDEKRKKQVQQRRAPQEVMGMLEILRGYDDRLSAWQERHWADFEKNIENYYRNGFPVITHKLFDYFSRHPQRIPEMKADLGEELRNVAWGGFFGFFKLIDKYSFTLEEEMALLYKYMSISNLSARDFLTVYGAIRKTLRERGRERTDNVDAALRQLYRMRARKVEVVYEPEEKDKIDRGAAHAKLTGLLPAAGGAPEGEAEKAISKALEVLTGALREFILAIGKEEFAEAKKTLQLRAVEFTLLNSAQAPKDYLFDSTEEAKVRGLLTRWQTFLHDTYGADAAAKVADLIEGIVVTLESDPLIRLVQELKIPNLTKLADRGFTLDDKILTVLANNKTSVQEKVEELTGHFANAWFVTVEAADLREDRQVQFGEWVRSTVTEKVLVSLFRKAKAKAKRREEDPDLKISPEEIRYVIESALMQARGRAAKEIEGKTDLKRQMQPLVSKLVRMAVKQLFKEEMEDLAKELRGFKEKSPETASEEGGILGPEYFYAGYFDDLLHLVAEFMVSGVCTWVVRAQQAALTEPHFGMLAVKDSSGRISAVSQAQVTKTGIRARDLKAAGLSDAIAIRKSPKGWKTLALPGINLGDIDIGDEKAVYALLEAAQRLAHNAGMQGAVIPADSGINTNQSGRVGRVLQDMVKKGWLVELHLEETVFLSGPPALHYSYSRVYLVQLPISSETTRVGAKKYEPLLEPAALDEVLEKEKAHPFYSRSEQRAPEPFSGRSSDIEFENATEAFREAVWQMLGAFPKEIVENALFGAVTDGVRLRIRVEDDLARSRVEKTAESITLHVGRDIVYERALADDFDAAIARDLGEAAPEEGAKVEPVTLGEMLSEFLSAQILADFNDLKVAADANENAYFKLELVKALINYRNYLSRYNKLLKGKKMWIPGNFLSDVNPVDQIEWRNTHSDDGCIPVAAQVMPPGSGNRVIDSGRRPFLLIFVCSRTFEPGCPRSDKP
ncbi:MAG: HEAT repeat domain-containing protein, partial [Planctomycetota bacterium]